MACAGERDRAKARAADLVHGERAHLGRQSAKDRSLSRRVLAKARLKDATHDAVVHLCRLDSGAPYRFAHHQRAQLRSGKGLQRTLELADGRPNGRNDHDLRCRH